MALCAQPTSLHLMRPMVVCNALVRLLQSSYVLIAALPALIWDLVMALRAQRPTIPQRHLMVGLFVLKFLQALKLAATV
jgi:hypothetical protein